MAIEYAIPQLFKDIVVVLAPLAGLAIAWCGLSTWRRQLRGGSKFQVGQKTLRALFSVRESVRSARDRWFIPGEIKTGEERTGDYLEDRARRYVEAYEKRLNNIVSSRNELYSSMIDAEVLWGRTAIPEIVSVLRVVDRLTLDAFPAWREVELAPSNLRELVRWDIEGRKKNCRVVFAPVEGDDEYGKELDKAIEKAEIALRKHFGMKVNKK